MKISLIWLLLASLLQVPCFAKDRLLQNEMLRMGESIYSPNGQYKLIMQTDGSLAMYRVFDGSLRYGMAKYGSLAIMQSDGNFVEYKETNPWTPIWASNTGGKCEYCWLQIWDDGNLSVGLDGVPWLPIKAWQIGRDPQYIDPATVTQSPGTQALSPPGPAPVAIPNIPVQQRYLLVR